MKKQRPGRPPPRRKPLREALKKPPPQSRAVAAVQIQEIAPPGSGPPGDPMTYEHASIEDVPEAQRAEAAEMMREIVASGDLCGVFRRPDGVHVLLVRPSS
jgi:hypothetical protein